MALAVIRVETINFKLVHLFLLSLDAHPPHAVYYLKSIIMRRSRTLPFWLMAVCIFSYSCGSNQSSETEKSTDTAKAATTTTAPAETTPASTTTTSPQDVMVVVHKVKDFAKWKESYDAHDSMRLASGVHSYVIGRGAKDTSMVLVAVKVDDMQKAKAFAKNPSLKQAMQKGGVLGAPAMKFYTLVFRDTGNVSTDLRSYTTITVKDWDKWQKAFDSSRHIVTDNGLAIRAYGHDADDNHKVTIVSAITDTAKAMAYWKSDMIKQRMAASGVTGQPVRFIYHMVQHY